MTEIDWLVCKEPRRMLTYLTDMVVREGRRLLPIASNRKLRMFSCACLAIVHGENWQFLTKDYESAEDGKTPYGKLTAATQALTWGTTPLEPVTRSEAADLIRDIFDKPVNRVRSISGCRRPQVVGRFQPCECKECEGLLKWESGLIPLTAKQIYDSKEFSMLPLLADMLEDAGSKESRLLSHLRGGVECDLCKMSGECTLCNPKEFDAEYRGKCVSCKNTNKCFSCKGTGFAKSTTPHVRGCWALDLILRKE